MNLCAWRSTLILSLSQSFFFIKGSTEIANFDFRGDGRFTFEVEEEARDCFSWQQDQVDRKHKRLL